MFVVMTRESAAGADNVTAARAATAGEAADLESLYERLGEETVTLDVGGVTFRTQYRTLARWPGTRLFTLAYQRAVRPHTTPTQLFYDRDPDVFSSVLDYYRSGLSLPAHSNMSQLLKRYI